MRRIILLTTAVLLTITGAQAQKEIWTLDDLKHVVSYSDYILMADIDAGDWEPLGTYTSTFDGNGHTITINVSNVDETGAQTKGYGLFKQLNGATVKNLTVKGTVTGQYQLGGIAGRVMNHSVVSGCVSEVTVHLTSGSYDEAGAIAGICQGGSQIIDCVARGSVTCNRRSGGQEITNKVGGIVGSVKGTEEDSCRVTGCYFEGEVSNYQPDVFAGCIAGSSEYTIIDHCTYDATASGGRKAIGSAEGSYDDASHYVMPMGYLDTKDGWLEIGDYEKLRNISTLIDVGDETVMHTDIRLTGDIVCTKDDWWAFKDYYGTFDGSGHSITFDGALVVKVSAKSMVSNYFGLVRNLYGTVKNLTAKGEVNLQSDRSNWYYEYAGGIAACMYGNSRIDNCVSEVAFSGKVATSVGGIVGWMEGDAQVTNCKVTGAIDVGYCLTSSYYTGGIVGKAKRGHVSDCYVSATLKNGAAGIAGSKYDKCTMRTVPTT